MAFLPPNSRVAGITCEAAVFAVAAPAAVDPVREIFLMSGWEARSCGISGPEAGTYWTTFGGRTDCIIWIMRIEVRGACSPGLMIIVFPGGVLVFVGFSRNRVHTSCYCGSNFTPCMNGWPVEWQDTSRDAVFISPDSRLKCFFISHTRGDAHPKASL